MRPISYKDKKRMYALIIVAIIMTVALIYLRFVLGGDEDSWICEYGQWVRHGNPTTEMPTSECN